MKRQERPRLQPAALLRPAALIVVLVALGAGASTAGAVTVTKTADTNDGECVLDCSLREAIDIAVSGETVTLPASATPYQVTDALGTLVIQESLTIEGAGARSTEVTAPGTTPGVSVRPFTIRSPALTVPTVTIRDLSITGGNGQGAAQSGQGGGVLAYRPGGTLDGPKAVLERVRVANNVVNQDGASQGVGGGVSSDGVGTQVTIRDSLIAGNMVVGTNEAQSTGGGLAIFAGGTFAIENTTIVDNQALSNRTTGFSATAGGASLGAGSSMLNVTFSGNSALKTAPGALDGNGGNLASGSTVTLRNTIVTAGVADNAATENCVGSNTTQGGNVMATDCGPGSADRIAADAMLGPLANNGGQTDTLALLAGSAALDAGTGCPPPAADQRGAARPQGVACDSGAFELEVATPLPATPSNQFSFGKVKLNKKKGTAQLTVNVLGPGELVASGNGVKSASAAQAVAAKTVPAAGPVQLLIRAKGKKRKKLRSTGKVKLNVAVIYTPTGGTANTKVRKIRLRKTR